MLTTVQFDHPQDVSQRPAEAGDHKHLFDDDHSDAMAALATQWPDPSTSAVGNVIAMRKPR